LASATIIVTTLALANMCLTHLILPGRVLQIDQEHGIYRQLRWSRRALITLLILGGYGVFISLRSRQGLTDMGLVAFTGTLQFLPGVIAALYWPGANRRGLLSGLSAGLSVWFVALFLPMTADLNPTQWLTQLARLPEQDWSSIALLSLALNTTLFIVVSLITPARPQERVAAEICSMDNISRPVRRTLSVQRAADFAPHLAPALGENTAQAEVNRALLELQFDTDEQRPYALRRLRNRLEANLSGLLGPAVAHNMVNRCLPFEPPGEGSSEDINLIERNLDRAQLRFTGLAADLNNLRRHYREILNNLPIGICSVGGDGELLMWNRAMERITAIRAESILGSHCSALPAPWRDILEEFLRGDENTILKKEVPSDSASPRWISLQKAAAGTLPGKTSRDQVMLIEDITEFELLEQELLHSERLASIGRLAAGVAHEIGNPVTGIACLAQNLEYETEPQEVRDTAQDILKQTERVSRIVESLVNFSHVGSGAGDIQLTACNLADCIDEAIHLLRLDNTAQAVKFDNLCDRELVVLADSQRLLQVFINLLGNARDASAADTTVTTRVRAGDEQVSIEVEDQGCGIPPALHSQVFEPFYTTKDPGKGTGLGLALVYSIMEDMGGTVTLESPIAEPPQAGTRFTLQLQRASYGATFQV
jgi:PAS domain S-box-containing protein